MGNNITIKKSYLIIEDSKKGSCRHKSINNSSTHHVFNCDNLNDPFEKKIGTDPTEDDTDGDGVLDGVEVIAGYDPLDASKYPGMPTETSSWQLPPSVLIGSGIVGGVAVLAIVVGVIVNKRQK